MNKVRCFGEVVRKKDNHVKNRFSGKTIRNIEGYQSVLKKAEELANDLDPKEYEVRIVCKVEKEW